MAAGAARNFLDFLGLVMRRPLVTCLAFLVGGVNVSAQECESGVLANRVPRNVARCTIGFPSGMDRSQRARRIAAAPRAAGQQRTTYPPDERRERRQARQQQFLP